MKPLCCDAAVTCLGKLVCREGCRGGAEGASLKCGLASAAKNPFAKKYSPVKELFIYVQLTIGTQTSRSFFFFGGAEGVYY